MGLFFVPKKNSFARVVRLRLENLEDRTTPTTFVVGGGGSTSLQHFGTIGGALAVAQVGDTIQVADAGVQTDTFNDVTLLATAIIGGTSTNTITTNGAFAVGSIITVGTGGANTRTVVDAVTPVAVGTFMLTLHDAITAPSAGFAVGTRVTVAGGTLAIDKPLTIAGLPTNSTVSGFPYVSTMTTLDAWGGSSGSSFQLLSSPVTIEDPTAFGSTRDAFTTPASSLSLVSDSLVNFTIPKGSGGNTITGSRLTSLTENGGGAAGNGNNVITNNNFTGLVTLAGNTSGTATNDVFSNNSFQNLGAFPFSRAGGALIVSNDDGVTVSNNTIASSGDAFSIRITNSQNITVNGNSTFAGSLGIQLTQTGTATLSGTVSNNTVQTFNGGGISVSMTDGTKVTLTVSGNDLRNNGVGVEIFGDATTNTTAAGTLTISGNDFHTYTAAANTANARASIYLGSAANGTVTATGNIFDSGVTGQTTARDGTGNTAAGGNFAIATGAMNTGTALDANSAFIQTLYRDFLNRSAGSADVTYWTNVLTANSTGSGGAAAGQLAVTTGITHSAEYFGRLVDSFYSRLLFRAADAAGKTYWVNQLMGGATEESVVAGFLSAPEFFANSQTKFGISPGAAGGFNQTYVVTLYNLLLGRNASVTDLSYWLNIANTTGIAAAANGFVNSAEFRQLQVAGYYNVSAPFSLFTPPLTLLNRTTTPTAAEGSFWANGTPNDLLSIQAGVAASPEFFTTG